MFLYGQRSEVSYFFEIAHELRKIALELHKIARELRPPLAPKMRAKASDFRIPTNFASDFQKSCRKHKKQQKLFVSLISRRFARK